MSRHSIRLDVNGHSADRLLARLRRREPKAPEGVVGGMEKVSGQRLDVGRDTGQGLPDGEG